MIWANQLMPVSLAAQFDPALLDRVGPRTARDWFVDTAGFLVAVTFGTLILLQGAHDTVYPLTGSRLIIDAVGGAICCLALWWRRRWPLGVALLCAVLGVFSTAATIAGLLALSSLAVHRSVRQVLFVAVLWIPQSIGYVIYSGRTDAPTVLLVALAMVLAATAWGMFVRARRQLLHTLRERALRAEADQLLHTENARMAERTRIAREMHDVLAHRISLVALHAGGLELRPELPPEQVQRTAALLRATARQALEELRSVIGILRENAEDESAPAAPQPTLRDINRLVEETRGAGTDIDFAMHVEQIDDVPAALGRDAYRIVQEALTNVRKHAPGSRVRVLVTGTPDDGIHISVRNRQPVPAYTAQALPGSGAGLLGLQERVALAGGTIVLGPDGAGDFVVEAQLTWQP
jgi:signal transduction histidine kinase